MSRTLLIGLDGATFTVLRPLMEQGIMPYLAEFCSGAVRGELMSTVNPLTPPAWTSLMTGRTPGEHGIYDFIRAEERGDAVYFVMNNSRDVRCETIWSIASRQDRSITALNFVGLNPPRPVNGHTIAGFIPQRHLKRAVWPQDLYDRFQALPGFNRKELAMDLDLEKKSIQGMPEDEYEPWIALHRRREQQWFDIMRFLMTTEPSDLTAIVLDGVDKLQHLCWRFVDPEHAPKSPTPFEARIREQVLGYYREVDRYIEGMVSMAGPEARVFLASDHGFGPTWELFYLNVWLEQRGLLAWRDESEMDEGGKIMVDRLRTHVNMLDWSKTKAYSLTPSSNGIHIRVARDGKGPGVAPERYEEFRSQLRQELLDYRDPASGEAVVTRVLTREEAYPGQAMDMAPDLLLTLRDGGFVSILNARDPLWQRPQIMGTHRPEGIFLGRGPGLKQDLDVGPLQITDIAPLLLHSIGLDVPGDFEGRVPEEIYEPAFLAEHPVRSGAPTLPPQPFDTPAADPKEEAGAEAEVMERLKALGYIE